MSNSKRTLDSFPDFMKNRCNKVKNDAVVNGIDGYVFDGADGSQVVFWESREGGSSEMHTHDYDEYVAVLQGRCELKVGNEEFTLEPGDEYVTPAGVPHGGKYTADYRSIDLFAKKRFEREK